MPSTEFQLINRFFRNALDDASGVKQGIGDDAAIVTIPAGMDLVLSMDTLVEGVHFHNNCRVADIGYKSLAVNLSDMAAMGAEPRWVMLSLTLPEADEVWIEQFMRGFSELARQYKVSLIGGDLTRGPLSITVEAHGLVPVGGALCRGGARQGDRVYVSGTLGDAGLALHLLQSRTGKSDAAHEHVIQRLHRPSPRIELGIALRGIANSAIDLSDGLIADLGHILAASKTGAIINVDAIPLSGALENHPESLHWALAAGDDYELCFSVPPDRKSELDKLAQDFPVTCIGEITAGEGIRWSRADGADYVPARAAWTHF